MSTITEVKYASIEKPWLKYFPAENIDKPLPQCTMYEWLKETCDGHHDIKAITYYGNSFTYGQMIDSIDRYAAAFTEFGIKKGEFVTLITHVIPETMYTIYALNKIGAVCNFIDPRNDLPHTVEFTRKAKSEVLILLDAMYEKFAPAFDDMGVKKIIVQEASQSLPPLKKLAMKLKGSKVPYDGKRIFKNADVEKLGIGKDVPCIPYEKDYPAVITRTGGTTGVSKGVVLTNDSLNAVSANFRDAGIKYEYGEKFLNFLPVGVSYGIGCGVHMGFNMTIENILVPKFKPDIFAKLIVKHKPNHVIGVPVFYENLMNSPIVKKMDLSFLSTTAAGGDSASAGFEEKLQKFFSDHGMTYPLAQGYGMSETSSAVAFGVQNIHRKGSAGVPCIHSCIAAFKPGTTEELPIGVTGELCISGPTLMKEYLYEPEETANVMWTHPDGTVWVHSGDLGRVDEDGFVFIEGRIKRSIVRFDGHKVYPAQLETVINSNPLIANCCVIGTKDMTHEQGFLPLVVFELTAEGKGKEDEMVKTVLEMCKTGMEDRSQPCGAVAIDKIPITNSSKNDYVALTKEFGNYDYLKK